MADIEATSSPSETTPLIRSGGWLQPVGDVIIIDRNKLWDSCSSSTSKKTLSCHLNEETQTEKKSGFKSLRNLSRKRKMTLILATSAAFLAGIAFSILGPIYPLEAERKGMDTTLIGLVFGMFGMVIFLTAPLFGNSLTKLGPKFTFIGGIFLGGCCNILFGTLYYCPGGTPFIVMSILIRSIEAIGFSAYITSSFAIVSSEFKDNIGLTYGILETGNSLGFMLGPSIGGALYGVGGFGVPLYCVGACTLINGLLAYIYLPSTTDLPAKRNGSMLDLLCNPMITVTAVSVVLAEIGMASYFATFAEHAKPLNISVFVIGILLGTSAFLNCITSLLWGYISDTLDIQAPLIIGGQFGLGIGFFLLGPSVLFPFIPFNLATTCTGFAFLGISLGSVFIPTIKCMVKGAIEQGFENGLDTYAMVSGLFNAAHTLGGFVGPVGIGALVESYGYPISYTVVGMASIIWMIVSLVFFTFRKFKKRV